MPTAQISDWLQAHHTQALDRWMNGLAAVTGSGAWVAVAALIALMLLLRGRRAEALWLFGGTCIGSSLAAVLKPLVHRVRPVSGASVPGWSFPSGHATSSIVFLNLAAYLIYRRIPRLAKAAWGIAACLVLLIGINRIYLAAHWPADVVGGWLIGGGFASLWCRGLRQSLDDR